jgi:hypothetical protein
MAVFPFYPFILAIKKFILQGWYFIFSGKDFPTENDRLEEAGRQHAAAPHLPHGLLELNLTRKIEHFPIVVEGVEFL